MNHATRRTAQSNDAKRKPTAKADGVYPSRCCRMAGQHGCFLTRMPHRRGSVCRRDRTVNSNQTIGFVQYFLDTCFKKTPNCCFGGDLEHGGFGGFRGTFCRTVPAPSPPASYESARLQTKKGRKSDSQSPQTLVPRVNFQRSPVSSRPTGLVRVCPATVAFRRNHRASQVLAALPMWQSNSSGH